MITMNLKILTAASIAIAPYLDTHGNEIVVDFYLGADRLSEDPSFRSDN